MYGLAALTAVAALLARRGGVLLQCGTIAAWAAIYAVLLFAIDRRAPRLGERGMPGGPGLPH
jgi:hypothetical protein